MIRRGAFSWGVWLWLLLGGLPARAAQPALHWVRAKGAERCIDPVALAERVEALTGPVFVPPGAAELSVEGLVSPASGGFTVRLVSSSRGGVRSAERVLRSSGHDCRVLDAAVAFVIALTLDPDLARAGIPSEVLAHFTQEVPPEQLLLAELDRPGPAATVPAPEPPPVAAPSAPSKPAAAPARSPAADASRRFRPGLSLAAAAQSGNAPSWLAGVRAGLGLGLPRHLMIALALGAFPSFRAQAVGEGRSASFQAYDATLSLCPNGRWQRWHALACVGVMLAYLRAEGRDFERNHA
ncbi:MAG TPA: hypothetical protein VFZ61_26250, partial [Polyangiales bacterium]